MPSVRPEDLPTDFGHVDGVQETRDKRLAELEAAVRAALNMVDGNGVPPNWDWMRAVLEGKTAEYYSQNANQE